MKTSKLLSFALLASTSLQASSSSDLEQIKNAAESCNDILLRERLITDLGEDDINQIFDAIAKCRNPNNVQKMLATITTAKQLTTVPIRFIKAALAEKNVSTAITGRAYCDESNGEIAARIIRLETHHQN